MTSVLPETKADVPPLGWDLILFNAYDIRTVLDVGANRGGFVPSWLGCGAVKVHAIEPVPDCFNELEQKFANDSRVECHRYGVSDSPGKLHNLNVFHCWTIQPNEYKGFNRSVGLEKNPPFDMDIRTIDSLLMEWDFKPDFIKIDTDGYDVKALKGASTYIETYKPILMLEISYMPEIFFGDCFPCEIRKLYNLGYSITKVNGGKRFPTMKDFMREFPWDTSFDVVCEIRK